MCVCVCVCVCVRAHTLDAVSLQLELSFCAKSEEKLIYILKQKSELGVPVIMGEYFSESRLLLELPSQLTLKTLILAQ